MLSGFVFGGGMTPIEPARRKFHVFRGDVEAEEFAKVGGQRE